MKKRLFSLIVAICLIVALVPVLASADPATATITFGGQERTVTQGAAASYFTTTGGTVASGDATTYNIKYEYPTNGVPTLSLKGAYLTDPIVNTSAVDVKIVIEKADAATTVPQGETADSYLTGGISWENGTLAIEGKDDSVLKIVSAGHGINLKKTTAAFKDLDLDISVAGSGIRAIKTVHANVTFDGCDVKLYSAASVAYGAEGTEGTDSTMTMNNSSISAESGTGMAMYVVDTKHIITVNSGELTVQSGSGKASQFNAAGQVKVNGGTVVMSGTTTGCAPDLSGYANRIVSVSATKTDGTEVAAWDGTTSLHTYKYFKIEPDTTPEVKASITLSGAPYEAVQGEDPLYFTTDSDGEITEDGTEQTYNIKFEYPEGEDAVPVLYLRGAYISSVAVANIESNGNSAAKTKIVVQKTTNGTVTVGTGTKNADAYLDTTVSWYHGELLVEGDGKLLMETEKDAFYVYEQDVTFKDLELEINMTGSAKCITGRPDKITFDNCTAVLNADTSSVFQSNNTSVELYGIVVTNNADVTMTSKTGQTIYSMNPYTKIEVNSGSLKVTTGGATNTAIRLDSANITINGGTVELISPAKAAYAPLNEGGVVPVLTGYAGCTAVAGEDAATATTYNGSDLANFKYFKVSLASDEEDEHTHSTTLVKGKAPSCTAAGEKDYYKCDCGKYFEDEAATKEITDVNTWKVLEATGHKDADKDGNCDTCKAVQTSDSSFTALWITVLTLSAMGICVTFVYNKKVRA